MTLCLVGHTRTPQKSSLNGNLYVRCLHGNYGHTCQQPNQLCATDIPRWHDLLILDVIIALKEPNQKFNITNVLFPQIISHTTLERASKLVEKNPKPNKKHHQNPKFQIGLRKSC